MNVKGLTQENINEFLAEYQHFMNEICESVDSLPEEKIYEFLKRRRERIKKIRDFRRSQNAKAQWRRNRQKMMQGIKKYHKSLEGKRFHRALSRYNSTRESYDIEALAAISSLKTHLYLDLQYYRPLHEELEMLDNLDLLIEALTEIEHKMFAGEQLDNDEIELIQAVVSSFNP